MDSAISLSLSLSLSLHEFQNKGRGGWLEDQGYSFSICSKNLFAYLFILSKKESMILVSRVFVRDLIQLI